MHRSGKTVVDSLPENDDACAELLEILVDYLPKRYPTLFEHIGVNGIWNKITGERFHDLTGKSGVDALVVISRLVQDDFLMGREREDGHVYFVGGLVAFPGLHIFRFKFCPPLCSHYSTGFYLLSNYIDKPLEEVCCHSDLHLHVNTNHGSRSTAISLTSMKKSSKASSALSSALGLTSHSRGRAGVWWTTAISSVVSCACLSLVVDTVC